MVWITNCSGQTFVNPPIVFVLLYSRPIHFVKFSLHKWQLFQQNESIIYERNNKLNFWNTISIVFPPLFSCRRPWNPALLFKLDGGSQSVVSSITRIRIRSGDNEFCRYEWIVVFASYLFYVCWFLINSTKADTTDWILVHLTSMLNTLDWASRVRKIEELLHTPSQ